MLEIQLINDDCLAAMAHIPGASIDMILCDLPYGTTYNKWDSVIPFVPLWEQYERIIKPNGAIVLTAQSPFDKILGCSNLKLLRYEWLWQKDKGTGFLNAHKMPLKFSENILVFYKKLPTYNPQMLPGERYSYRCKGVKSLNYNGVKPREPVTIYREGRFPVNIIKFNQERGLHPTQKPVALMEYLIRTYTNAGELVLDNCMGSGTTGISCIRSGRHFIGIEKDPVYFDVAKRRIGQEQDALIPGICT